MPVVTVVIPCWNAGRFLDGLFASLEAQTFRDFETVIVDDGSTDPETLAKLDTLPASVRLVRQKNGGLSSARNTGIREAKGEFVLPLDCDDRLESAFLEEAVRRLQSGPKADFVFSHMRLTGAREGVLERAYNVFDQLFLNQLPYCLLMRKSAWQAVGGYDEAMRDGYEDWDFNLRLTAAGYIGGGLGAPLFIYRVADDGMLLAKSARRHGTLWKSIRSKHPGAYRPDNLISLKWQVGPSKVSATRAALLLGSAWLLPNSVFGWLFHRVLKNLQGRARR
jgi:glycosyltransferase involved in cell wall biosynthesis